MTIRYIVEERDQYLLFTGEGTEGDLDGNIIIHKMIVDACKKRNCQRVLIDDRNVVYTATASSIYSLAKHYSEMDVPRFILRAAVLADQAYRSDNKFFENVMQNRGINLRIFYELEAAEKWLTT